MARSENTKLNIAGFTEEVINAGTTETISLKVTYGESYDEYARENVWFNLLDLKYSDQERVIEKINYKAIRDNVGEFSSGSKLAGARVKPEIVRIPMDETKEWAAVMYEKDYELSNFPSTAGKIVAKLYAAPESYMDDKIQNFLAAQVEANTLITPAEFDTSVEITAANGELFYNAILNQMMKFRETGKDNDYNEGSVIPKNVMSIAINERGAELLVASKRIFIDQAGTLNTGGFGSMFRDVKIEVASEFPEGYNCIIMTSRAIAGSQYVRHAKLVGAEANQDAWETEVNVVHDFGANVVFENEVTGIKLPTTPEVPAK